MSTATALVKKLALEQRQDILCEINSHIFEALQQQFPQQLIQDTTPMQLEDILEKLGLPATFILEMISSASLGQAVAPSTEPVSLLKMPIMLARAIVNLVYYTTYTLMLIAIFLVVAKFVDPQRVGFFYAPNKFFIFGKLILQQEEAIRYEQLGNYFIPVLLFIIIGLYYSSTLILKIKKSIYHKL
ncbi:hypothetical protein [Sphingobacterium sp. 2149]|uniref:hypothetical protein n=1 Tax=Sphingobacterium sp. 2149 TaxID=2817763 RepID=UPI001AE39EF1|nr:hypothetical protein [Sphingobacterium sp. 2149]MDR6735156.1 hypothetical protein [Sphingobacterium sp. 2149]